MSINIRVTEHASQGARKYMEDILQVKFKNTADNLSLDYVCVGVYDGHGGSEAAVYAKEHLFENIENDKNFHSDNSELVLQSITNAFKATHVAMWQQLDKWPKNKGFPSTSGTTASVAILKDGKIFIGHVGDSRIVLAVKNEETGYWAATPLTTDHKPIDPVENKRILDVGGNVVSNRVVWSRPQINHKGPVRRSTRIDHIPFLATSRSLGDLWSFNYYNQEYTVSPVPDVSVLKLDANKHMCLILGSDGLWDTLTSQDAVNSVWFAEKEERTKKNPNNPSKMLVDKALVEWEHRGQPADNTSVITVLLNPSGAI